MGRMMEAEIWTIAGTDQGNAVLLRPLGSDTAVPIFIGQLEAQSILAGYGTVPLARPLTHDLMLSLLKQLKVRLLRIEITALVNNTFHARLLLQEHSRSGPLGLDCRPSDALALAVRCACPVFIAEAVIVEAGIPVALILESAEEPGEEQKFIPVDFSQNESSESLKTLKRMQLRAELERLVQEEEYEKAAEIRDMLALLDKNETDQKD
ncbi:MAG: bifunctional nuclease family protein [Spirochaetaceae bacterium]|jgi:bifunctional DNase/RNase|nr:bifunctional nuclease family protein [Spirochaetaceae bacterium]